MTIQNIIDKYKKLQKEYETITLAEVIKDLRSMMKTQRRVAPQNFNPLPSKDNTPVWYEYRTVLRVVVPDYSLFTRLYDFIDLQTDFVALTVTGDDTQEFTLDYNELVKIYKSMTKNKQTLSFKDEYDKDLAELISFTISRATASIMNIPQSVQFFLRTKP